MMFTFRRSHLFDVTADSLQCSKCGKWLTVPQECYSNLYSFVNVICSILIAAFANHLIDIHVFGYIIAIVFIVMGDLLANHMLLAVVLTCFPWVSVQADAAEKERFIISQRERAKSRKRKCVQMMIAGSFLVWAVARAHSIYVLFVAAIMAILLLFAAFTRNKKQIKPASIALLFLIPAGVCRLLFISYGLTHILDILSLGIYAYFCAFHTDNGRRVQP